MDSCISSYQVPVVPTMPGQCRQLLLLTMYQWLLMMKKHNSVLIPSPYPTTFSLPCQTDLQILLHFYILISRSLKVLSATELLQYWHKAVKIKAIQLADGIVLSSIDQIYHNLHDDFIRMSYLLTADLVWIRYRNQKKQLVVTFQLVKHSTIFPSMDKFKVILKLNNRAQVLDTYWTQESFTNLHASHIN